MARKYSDKELLAFVSRIDSQQKARIAKAYIRGLHGVPEHEKAALTRTIETIKIVNGWGD